MKKASAFAALWGASLMMGQARPHVLDAEPDPAKAAQLLWTKVLTHCGDSYYLLAHSSDDWDLTEYKEPRLDFHADTLSLADKLNGLEGQGTAMLSASAARSLQYRGPNSRPRWSGQKWVGAVYDGHPVATALAQVVTSLRVSMTRQRGHWEVSGGVKIFDDLTLSAAMPCSVATADDPFEKYHLPPPQDQNMRDRVSVPSLSDNVGHLTYEAGVHGDLALYNYLWGLKKIPYTMSPTDNPNAPNHIPNPNATRYIAGITVVVPGDLPPGSINWNTKETQTINVGGVITTIFPAGLEELKKRREQLLALGVSDK